MTANLFKLGCVSLPYRQGPQMQWTMEREGQYGTIQCLDNFDITGDGVRELVVGRHDGTIEVYAYEDGEDVEPTLRFSHVRSSLEFPVILQGSAKLLSPSLENLVAAVA